MKNNLNSIRFYLILFAGVFLMSFIAADNENSNTLDILSDNNTITNEYVYVVNLSGGQEVPSVDTEARGRAIVRISRNEDAVYYKVIVHNIDNVVASHFHMAPIGVSGPVVHGIYMSAPTGNLNGMLTQGVVTDEDVDINMFINGIRSGNMYINVHSTEYPSGEIRGQL